MVLGLGGSENVVSGRRCWLTYHTKIVLNHFFLKKSIVRISVVFYDEIAETRSGSAFEITCCVYQLVRYEISQPMKSHRSQPR